MSIYDAVSRYASPCERCGSVQFMHHKYSTQCDLDYIRKLEKENEELKSNLKFLVDEIFVGVELMEGSRIGNYLAWVKNIRVKLNKLKRSKANE